MNDKVAVVTGSSSGIGLLTSIELASRGYRVIATMRDLNRRERLAKAATAAGVNGKLDIRRLDVTEIDSIPIVVAAIASDYGRIDVLVNNAGFPMAGFAEDIHMNELREQFETNFFGHVAVTKAVLPIMRAQHSGHIVMVSSLSGRTGQPTLSSYAASKFALEGWSETLRIETRSLGIRVVLIEPGAFDTDIWHRNVRLGKNTMHSSSPNLDRARRFNDFVKSGGIKKGDPLEVARLIARVAENPNPKLRYLVGRDAFLQVWLKALLPWRRYERLVAKAVKID